MARLETITLSSSNGTNTGEVIELLELLTQAIPLRVEHVQGNESTGPTKGPAIDIGTYVISTVLSGGSIAAIASVLSKWSRRARTGSVRLQIGEDSVEISDASESIEKEVLSLLRQHAAKRGEIEG